MNVYSLLLNRRRRASLLAGLLVGLLAQHALAADDVVVARGAEAAAAAQAGRESLQAAMSEYVRSINEEMRAMLESSLQRRPEPQLQLAAHENSTRG
jgi:hypothetical protein